MARMVTSSLTVNAAFLQEIKEVNLDLWRLLDEVRHLVEHRERMSQRMLPFVTALEELRDQLALHFALEEAYGYFEDPVYVAPQLCEQAHALRAEHRQLYVQISSVADLASQLRSARGLESTLDRVREQFLAFDEQLRRHEAAENDLIFREYGDDIGVGD
jgi:hypothetical protein